MKLGRPIEIAEGVHQIPVLAARVTVLSSGGEVTLVDSGERGSLRLISSGLATLGIRFDQVGLVVLTHYHPDHSGSLGKLVEASSAKVAVHRLEAEIIRGNERPPSPFRSGFMASLTGPLMGPMYGDSVDVDYELEDGDRLALDEEVRVVHVPGHTPGSISLHMPALGVLIVGDAMQYRLRKLGPPAAAVTQDPEMALQSLQRLLSLDFDTIVFSHFQALRRGARDALEKMLGDKA